MRRLWYYIRNVAFPFVVLIVLFIYAMFRGYFIGWFLFYSFLPIVLYQIMFVFYPMKRWKIARKLSQSGTVAGSVTEVIVTVERSFPFPLVYCICEEIL